jgi:hypothetical protein|tara:strand:- start:3337 stop:3777 length:441 start_codon:yes stop_codon:yes gene_type:complete
MRVEKIETFNKENLEQLKEAINNSLGLIGRTFGIEINLASVSYRDYNFTGKLEANLEEKDGELFTKDAEYYKNNCTDYGLEPDWLGTSFIHKDKMYMIVGLNPRASKMPVNCVSGGQAYKFTVSSIKKLVADHAYVPGKETPNGAS